LIHQISPCAYSNLLRILPLLIQFRRFIEIKKTLAGIHHGRVARPIHQKFFRANKYNINIASDFDYATTIHRSSDRISPISPEVVFEAEIFLVPRHMQIISFPAL